MAFIININMEKCWKEYAVIWSITTNSQLVIFFLLFCILVSRVVFKKVQIKFFISSTGGGRGRGGIHVTSLQLCVIKRSQTVDWKWQHGQLGGPSLLDRLLYLQFFPACKWFWDMPCTIHPLWPRKRVGKGPVSALWHILTTFLLTGTADVGCRTRMGHSLLLCKVINQMSDVPTSLPPLSQNLERLNSV